jgi:hypothetical protein
MCDVVKCGVCACARAAELKKKYSSIALSSPHYTLDSVYSLAEMRWKRLLA